MPVKTTSAPSVVSVIVMVPELLSLTSTLPENVVPTIQGRDFVIATLAAPTVIKEPEKPAEETTEGAEGAEGTTEGVADGEAKAAAEGDKKEGDKDKKEGEKREPEKKEPPKEKK